MAHVDDLTFINAAQLLGSDELYIGRPSDTVDPDKRTDVDELSARLFGPITTNANGSYIQLGNGFQVCWIAGRSWTTDANGNNSWTFPASFTELPACWGLSFSAGYDIREFRSGSSTGSMRVKAINVAGNNYANSPVVASLFAIGKWK